MHQRNRESILGKDSSVPLMHHDPGDLGSLISDFDHPKESHPERRNRSNPGSMRTEPYLPLNV